MQLPAKYSGRLTALALLAFAALLFFPALFDGRILAPLDITTRLLAPWNEEAGDTKPHNHNPSDAVIQYLPYRVHAARSLEEDGYIGWNPYSMGGYSLAANTMALPASWTMQLHRFLGFKDAWNLGIYLEFLIAGFGMLVFLRSRKLPWWACLVGAAAYMANSQFIIWIYHRWALSSFCWMPWVLWAATGWQGWKDLGPRQCLLPFFLALAVLGGSLQHMVFVGLACGCLFGVDLMAQRTVAAWRRALVFWSAAGLLAVGLTAFSLIPQIQGYLTNVGIGHVRGGIGYHDGWGQPFLNLLALPLQIWPWLLGDPQTIDAWKILKSDFMNVAYLGTVPTLLAICGLFVRGMPAQAKWLIAVGLLIPLTPLVGPLYHRVQLLFLLGGAWMAAEMLAMMAASSSSRIPKAGAAATVALGLLLLAGALLPGGLRGKIEEQVVSRSLERSAQSQFGDDAAWIESRARAWTDRFSLFNPRTLWVFGLVALGSGGLLSIVRQPRAAKIPWGYIAVFGATSLELATFFQTWTTFSEPSALNPHHPLVEAVRKEAGSNRVLQGLGAGKIGESFAAPNLLASYSIPSVDAYESIQYRSTSFLLADLPASDRLSLAGVGVSVQSKKLPTLQGTEAWPLVRNGGNFEIRRNPHVLAPLLAIPGDMPSSPAELLQLLNQASPLTPSLVTMNRWQFEWPSDANWIRIAQNWHPGWRWRLPNGSWQPVVDGPDGTCWLRRPTEVGTEIEVRFVPSHTAWSFVALGSGIFGLVLILARMLPRRPAT